MIVISNFFSLIFNSIINFINNLDLLQYVEKFFSAIFTFAFESFLSTIIVWFITLVLISLMIFQFVKKLFDKSLTSKIFLRVMTITAITSFYISLFGVITLSSWVGIMSFYTFVLYIMSKNFIGNFFGIKKDNIDNRKIINLNAVILLSIPLLYISISVVNVDNINYLIDKHPAYVKTKLENVETIVNNKYNKPDELEYTEHGFEYKSVNKDTKIKNARLIIPIESIYVKFNKEDWKIEKVITSSKNKEVDLLLRPNNSFDLTIYLIIGVYRIAALEVELLILFLGIALINIAIGKAQRERIHKFMYLYFGGEPELYKFQGHWYRIQKYPLESKVESKEYLNSISTFSIVGNELRVLDCHFEIYEKGNKFYLKLDKGKKKLIWNSDESLGIDGFVFVKKESKKWNELYTPYKKINKNKTHFVSKKYVFLEKDIDTSNDSIYYLNDNCLIENRSKNCNSYRIIKGTPITRETTDLTVKNISDSDSLANIEKHIKICSINTNKENKFFLEEVTEVNRS